MTLPTIGMVLKKIHTYGIKTSISKSFAGNPKAKITGLNTSAKADKGELAWLSAKNSKNFNYSGFKGLMLICPESSVLPTESHALFVVAENPKLLFAKIFHDFLSDLSVITWSKTNKKATIGKNVKIGKGAVLGSNVTIRKNVSIGPNTVIANCEIGENTVIGANCSIGLTGFGFVKDADGKHIEFPHIGKVLIGKNVRIGSNTCIDRGALDDTVIQDFAKIDNLVHVAHNVIIGNNTLVIANTMIGGSAVIGNNAWIAPSVSVLNQIDVDDGAIIGMGAVVLKDVEKNSVVVGNPGRVLKKTS